MCEQHLTAEEHPLGVDSKCEVPIFLRVVLSRAVSDDASVVDSNVQPTQLAHNRVNHSA